MTRSLCYTHEALTSLAPHKRLPELPVIPREPPSQSSSRGQGGDGGGGWVPPRHAHGHLTSLAPHERLPELPVIPREPTPVFLPGESWGQRSLVGYSPWSHEEWDTTERLHFPFSLSRTGEGNGNPLQCSCGSKPWVPSTSAGGLRELLSVPLRSQGYPGVGRALSGLRWGWRNGRGPHLEGRQEPQTSSLFLP